MQNSGKKAKPEGKQPHNFLLLFSRQYYIALRILQIVFYSKKGIPMKKMQQLILSVLDLIQKLRQSVFLPSQ